MLQCSKILIFSKSYFLQSHYTSIGNAFVQIFVHINFKSNIDLEKLDSNFIYNFKKKLQSLVFFNKKKTHFILLSSRASIQELFKFDLERMCVVSSVNNSKQKSEGCMKVSPSEPISN